MPGRSAERLGDSWPPHALQLRMRLWHSWSEPRTRKLTWAWMTSPRRAGSPTPRGSHWSIPTGPAESPTIRSKVEAKRTALRSIWMATGMTYYAVSSASWSASSEATPNPGSSPRRKGAVPIAVSCERPNKKVTIWCLQLPHWATGWGHKEGLLWNSSLRIKFATGFTSGRFVTKRRGGALQGWAACWLRGKG